MADKAPEDPAVGIAQTIAAGTTNDENESTKEETKEESKEETNEETTETSEHPSKQVEIVNVAKSPSPQSKAVPPVITAETQEPAPSSPPKQAAKPKPSTTRSVVCASSYYPDEIVIAIDDPKYYEIKKSFFYTLLRLDLKFREARKYHREYCYTAEKLEDEFMKDRKNLWKVNDWMERLLIKYEMDYWEYHKRPPPTVECLVSGKRPREKNMHPDDRYRSNKDPYYLGRRRSRGKKYQRHIYNAQIVFNAEVQKVPIEHHFDIKFCGMQWVMALPLVQTLQVASNHGVLYLANLSWRAVRIGFKSDGTVKFNKGIEIIKPYNYLELRFWVDRSVHEETIHRITYYYVDWLDFYEVQPQFKLKIDDITSLYYGYGTVVVVSPKINRPIENETLGPECHKVEKKCIKMIKSFKDRIRATMTEHEWFVYKTSGKYDSNSGRHDMSIVEKKKKKMVADVKKRMAKYTKEHLTKESLDAPNDDKKVKASTVPEGCELKEDKKEEKENKKSPAAKSKSKKKDKDKKKVKKDKKKKEKKKKKEEEEEEEKSGSHSAKL